MGGFCLVYRVINKATPSSLYMTKFGANTSLPKEGGWVNIHARVLLKFYPNQISQLFCIFYISYAKNDLLAISHGFLTKSI